MKKKYGISIYGTLCSMSFLGIAGIIAWAATTVEMGGNGMTPGLLFAMFVLFLFGAGTAMMASYANFEKEYDYTEKCYATKEMGSAKQIPFPSKEIFTWSKGEKFCYFGALCAAPVSMLFLKLYFFKSVFMAMFVSIAVMFALLVVVEVFWDFAKIKRLHKMLAKPTE